MRLLLVVFFFSSCLGIVEASKRSSSNKLD